jgi:hypothetical protein
MTYSEINCNLRAIFGAGRSGTTWLGALVASHPEVSYRFEPFHRLQKKQIAIHEARQLMEVDTFCDRDLPQVYDALLPAYPELEKSPFFAKKFPTRLSWGKAMLLPIARKNPWGARLFRYLYTPLNSPMLVFKEVELIPVLLSLLERTNIPIVYLMRHPCAVVSSLIKGEQQALMPSGRRTVLKSILANNFPQLLQDYGDKLETLTTAEQQALLWLVDVQQAIQVCQKRSNGLVVIYEELVENPLTIATKVFKHYGLEMVPETLNFIKESSQASRTNQLKRGEMFINQYFTVYRDSKEARDSWKKNTFS